MVGGLLWGEGGNSEHALESPRAHLVQSVKLSLKAKENLDPNRI